MIYARHLARETESSMDLSIHSNDIHRRDDARDELDPRARLDLAAMNLFARRRALERPRHNRAADRTQSARR